MQALIPIGWQDIIDRGAEWLHRTVLLPALIAMLVMEAAFGIPGLVAAPIFYAYFKEELREKGLV